MKHLEINLAKGKNQKNEIFQKVKEIFLKTYNTIPENPKDHQHLIYVEEKTKILGTMGLIFSEEINEKMPYENYFLIEKKKNLAFIDEAHVYLTSWVSEKKDVGLILSYCSGIFSISKKCKYAVSIMKPNIARYLNFISDDSWKIIDNTTLLADNIREEDKNYFFSDPSPSLYYCNVQQCTKSLKNNISEKLFKELKINF